jgi:Xaa-Pro aminopeptidase/Xaa-Pro dipeptidase
LGDILEPGGWRIRASLTIADQEPRSMFDPATYQSRRTILAQAMDGIGLFPANPPSPMNYAANQYGYVQESCFAYYFGIPQPFLAGVIDFDSGDVAIFGDEPTLDDLIWLGSATPLAEWASRSGAGSVFRYAELPEWLKKNRRGRAVHYTPPFRGTTAIQISEWLGIPVADLARHAPEPLIRAIVAQREIKSAEEIAEMRSALSVTAEMHATAMRLSRAGVMEHEISGAMEGVARAADLTLAYPVIFSGLGEILHNTMHDRCLAAGDLVVNDSAAASRLGYASDITRTLPIGGRFDAKQRVCYELVLSAQKAAIDACGAGTHYLSVHKLAARVMAEGLIAEGLFRGDPEAIVETGAYALCFPHGVGHQIGLDVHDMETLGEDLVGYDEAIKRSDLFGLQNLRMAKPLKSGMVVTVEPGLYFIPLLIERWESEGRYRDLINYEKMRSFLGVHGIRIEDDVLVTNGSPRVLGPGIPKEIGEIEAALSA